MRYVSSAAVAALSIITSSVMFGQADKLSITNYQFVSEQFYSRTQSKVTYRADLANQGTAFDSVTATVTSSTPNVVVTPGDQDTLLFAPVPAHTQIPSNNTFTILVDRTVPFDFSSLHWTFVPSNGPPPPVANAGAAQMALVGQTVTLDGSGSTNPSGVGTLTYSWVFTSKPAGSTAVLNNPTSVMPTFVPDIAGDYVISLTVNNGKASSTASVTVSTKNPPAPIANAGSDQHVDQGATVVLNGSGSTSSSGKPLTYSWTLIQVPAGSTATLSGANTVSPTFVADKLGDYIAQLIVNDGIQNSAPSTVKISTNTVKPVANPGTAQVVNVNSLVQLDGSGSTDANGLPLTYQWSFVSVPAGSTAKLSDPTAVKPTFTPDQPGMYVVQLIVNNGVLSSDAKTVTITTQPPVAPTANAGPNQTVQRGSTVQLTGSGTDPPEPATYVQVVFHQ